MVRKITRDDREIFLALTREFYASDAVLHDVPDAYHTDAFAEMMRSQAYISGYLIECDGAVAGYGLTARSYSHEAGGPVVWLEELYIRAEFRSRGLDSEFFRQVTEENRDARRFRLEVEPENVRAIALYRRLGYENLPYVQMLRDV